MKKSQKINLALFVAVCIVIMMFAYFFGSDFLKKQEKPWHMQPSVSDEFLSDDYLATYKTIESKSVLSIVTDSSKRVVNILVDAWGVPLDMVSLNNEMALFNSIPYKAFVHRRLAERTRHAEFVEMHTSVPQSIYLFGGDSLEYDRLSYIQGLGFRETKYCQNCGDAPMLSIIDSLLDSDMYKQIAWTSTGARLGLLEDLQQILKSIAQLAKKHPDIIFIVQGTHRPVLGTPERRKEFYRHWVPVVMLNYCGC